MTVLDAAREFDVAFHILRDAIRKDLHARILPLSQQGAFDLLTNIVASNTAAWSGGMRFGTNIVETMKRDAAIEELRNMRWPSPQVTR
jgi:hypothetical protein